MKYYEIVLQYFTVSKQRTSTISHVLLLYTRRRNEEEKIRHVYRNYITVSINANISLKKKINEPQTTQT
jgi:hypothetical protein